MNFKLHSLLFAAVAALSTFLAAGFLSPAWAKSYKLKPIYLFCGETDCTDGENPQALLLDPAGDTIYGTTMFGGVEGRGTVFTLARNKHGKWKHTKIYDFTCDGSCPGGWQPAEGKLILDTAGNLYGTTQRGGVGDSGGGYELVKDGKTWHFKALFDACQQDHCADGGATSGLTYAGASTGVPYDGVSPLYGTSITDGTLNHGIFFSLTTNGGNWTKNILYTVNGSSMGGILTMDSSGNFFGTGTSLPFGIQFLIELRQNGGHWGINTLHTFTGASDGKYPLSPVAIDAAGNVFGATQLGGNSQIIGGGGGTLFEWNISGFKTVEQFCSVKNCKDGYFASSGTTLDGDGNVLGVVDGGGKFGGGAVYRYNGASTNLVYSFCKTQSGDNCTDGDEPQGEVLVDASGDIFGATYHSANGNGGAVFELTP